MDALSHGQGSSSLMYEVQPGGGGGGDNDLIFEPDDFHYLGYDQEEGICGRPRQINVTRRIDLGGTDVGYEPVLNLLSEGGCLDPDIDGYLCGRFQSTPSGISRPVELWGAGATLAHTGNPIFIHSHKTLTTTRRTGSIVMAGYGEHPINQFARFVEVGLEVDTIDIDVFQYFAGNRQLIATGQYGEVQSPDSSIDVIGYGSVPSENYNALVLDGPQGLRAGLEIVDDGVNNPRPLCLWGKRDNAAYDFSDGDDGGLNCLILADINAASLNADHVILGMRWRNSGNDEADLFLFKDSEMEIVSDDQAAVLGTSADGVAAVGVQIGAENDFTTDGARLVEFVNDETEVRGFVDLNGDLGFSMRDNGQQATFETLTELTTIAAAASTDTAIQIPAGALVFAVSVRVTVVIPTAADFDVGVAGATDRYGDDILVAAGTTFVGTTDAFRYYAAATSIRITPDANPANNTGRVRVTVHFLRITAPTS
jgi:hypothetical protein